MPQQGNPDQVAQGNRDSLISGLDAIASGLQKYGENQREQKKLEQAQSNWEKQFAEQQRMNNQALLNQQYQLQQSQEQRQWLQKFYDQFFGNDDEYKELQELRKKFGSNGISDASLVMMGLNSALR
jgi:DNA repair exonuclease SbcCD ATPase subunit